MTEPRRRRRALPLALLALVVAPVVCLRVAPEFLDPAVRVLGRLVLRTGAGPELVKLGEGEPAKPRVTPDSASPLLGTLQGTFTATEQGPNSEAWAVSVEITNPRVERGRVGEAWRLTEEATKELQAALEK